MYVCMYVCMYVYTYECMYVCMYVYIYTYMYTYICKYMYIDVYMRTHATTKALSQILFFFALCPRFVPKRVARDSMHDLYHRFLIFCFCNCVPDADLRGLARDLMDEVVSASHLDADALGIPLVGLFCSIIRALLLHYWAR